MQQRSHTIKQILLVLIAFTIGLIADAALYQPDPYKVRRSLNVRSAPRRTAVVIHQYHVNDRFEVIEFTGSWAKVSVNGHIGYVSTDYIARVPESFNNRPAPKKQDDSSDYYFIREYHQYLSAKIMPRLYHSFPSDEFCLGTILLLMIIGIGGWFLFSDPYYNYRGNRAIIWFSVICWIIAALLSVSYFTNAPNPIWFFADCGFVGLIVGCVILGLIIIGMGFGYLHTLQHIYVSAIANFTCLVPICGALATGVTYVVHHIFHIDLSTWLPSVCLVAIALLSIVNVIAGSVNRLRLEALSLLFLLTLSAGIVIYIWASIFFMILSFLLFLLCILLFILKMICSPSSGSSDVSFGGESFGGGNDSSDTSFNTEHGRQNGYWRSGLFNSYNGHRYTPGGDFWD